MKRFQNFLKSLFDKREISHNKNISFLGGLLIYFCLGGMTMWGYINVYIASYFNALNSELSIKKANLYLIIMCFPMCLASFFSIQLSQKVGFKLQIHIFTLIYSISVIISSFTTNFYVFVFFYGFLCSLSVGLIYIPIICIMWSYFPELKGKISGYMFGMFGLAAMVIVPIITYAVNPENIKIDKSNSFFPEIIYKEVPSVLFYLGIFYFMGTQIGVFLIKSPDQILTYEKINKSLDEESNAMVKYTTLKEGLRSKPFLILFINSLLMSLFVSFLNLNFKLYGLLQFNDDHFITILTFANGTGAFLGRIFFGHIMDKLGFKRIYLLLFALLFLFALSFAFISSNKFLYTFWILSIASLDGGINCIVGPGLVEIFGMDMGSKLFPYKNSSFYLSLLIVPLVQYFLMNIASLENIFVLFGLGIGMATLFASYFVKKMDGFKN